MPCKAKVIKITETGREFYGDCYNSPEIYGYCMSCWSKVPEAEKKKLRIAEAEIKGNFCKNCGVVADYFCPKCGNKIKNKKRWYFLWLA